MSLSTVAQGISLTALRELEEANGKCLHAVQQRLANLRVSLHHMESQRAAAQLLHHQQHSRQNDVPLSSSSLAYIEEFYKPRIVDVTASKKNKGGKRGRDNDAADIYNNNTKPISKVAEAGDLDLSGLFGDSDEGDAVVTSKPTQKMSASHTKPSSAENVEGSGGCEEGVDGSCIMQLDVLDDMKHGGGASIRSSPSPLAALCFAAVEQGFTPSPQQTPDAHDTTPPKTDYPQPLSGVALLELDNIPRMRSVELFPHILTALENIGRGTTTTASGGGMAVVGGIVQPGCWHDIVVNTAECISSSSTTRVSIPIGDLDPFSSHILLAHLRVARSKRAVGKPLSLLTPSPSPSTSSPITSSEEVHHGNLMTQATEAELATIVATEHLFPSPYKGPRGHGVTPSVLPRARGSSGMKAISSSWTEEEDELLMQLVLDQMRKESNSRHSQNSLITPTPTTANTGIDWPHIGAEMGSLFGVSSVGANAMASWLRWENVLRPVVSSAALGAELSFEDNITSRNGNSSNMKSQYQNQDSKCRESQNGDDVVVVEGSQRLRGLGELFKGSSTNKSNSLNSSNNKKYQSAEAWPTADDEFLWALVRQANFKLDRTFWLRLKHVAPLRDSYAPFAILQRFQQFTNPLHCPTLLSVSTKATIAKAIGGSSAMMRRYDSDDDDDVIHGRNVASLSSPRGGGGSTAAQYQMMGVQRTHEVVLVHAATAASTSVDRGTTTTVNDKYPTTYGFCLKNQHGVVDVTPIRSSNVTNRGPLLHPIIRARLLPKSPFVAPATPRRGTVPGDAMITAESMQFEDSFTPISSTSPTTPSFPAAAAAAATSTTTTATRRRHRTIQLNGWSTQELQTLLMLVKSFVNSKNLSIGGHHSSSTSRVHQPPSDGGSGVVEDPWFGVDMSLIHNDFTTMCCCSSSIRSNTGNTKNNGGHNDEGALFADVTEISDPPRVVGPLGGQSLDHCLQFHTKEQLRGVLRSLNVLNSAANKE